MSAESLQFHWKVPGYSFDILYRPLVGDQHLQNYIRGLLGVERVTEDTGLVSIVIKPEYRTRTHVAGLVAAIAAAVGVEEDQIRYFDIRKSEDKITTTLTQEQWLRLPR